MTMYLSNRDGNGKTDEEGHYKFPVNAFAGNVLLAPDLLVTQQSPVTMGVTVAAGMFKVLDVSGRYSYTGWNDSAQSITISTADTSNSRITSIVVYIDKLAPTSPAPPNNPGVAKFIAVNGNPAASPTVPSNATIQTAIGAGNPYIIIANVTVPANASSIVTSNISDARTVVTIGSNMVNTASIQDLSVTTAKIADLGVTTGKIANAAVTEDKWRNSVAFRASRTAAYNSIAGNSTSGFNFDTILYNYGSAYNTTTGLFTAPYNGVYWFYGQFFTETVSTGRAFVIVRGSLNALYKTRGLDGNFTSVNRIMATHQVYMNAGETFGLDVWTSSVNAIGNNETWFSGHLVTRV